MSGQWREFYAGERVMARDIPSQRWLFGVIAERNGPKSYVVQLDDGRIWKRHVDYQKRSEVGVEETPPPDIADMRTRAHTRVSTASTSSTSSYGRSFGSGKLDRDSSARRKCLERGRWSERESV